MQRRDFLKTGLILGAGFIMPNIYEIKAKAGDSKRVFILENSYDLNHEDAKAMAKLWIPIPYDSDYQLVGKLNFDGNYDEAFITNENDYLAKTLFAKWSKKESKKLNLKMTLKVKDRSVDLSKASDSMVFPLETLKFIEPTEHIPTDKKVKELSDKIVKDAKTPLESVRKIYDWVISNMYRDPNVKGCGVGDAGKAITYEIFGGKCTDISSVFVALVRSAGIPAREVFGLRLGASRFAKSFGKSDKNGLAKVSGGQHCRCEFYLNGVGWIPADPADVTKVMLAEKLTLKDAKVKRIKEFQFGNWEMNWIGFNYARDFVLSPEPIQKPLNMFGYPYAEVEDEVLDYYEPLDFSYSYVSQEV